MKHLKHFVVWILGFMLAIHAACFDEDIDDDAVVIDCTPP